MGLESGIATVLGNMVIQEAEVKKSIQFYQERALLHITSTEFSAMKWEFNQSKITDSFIKKKHLINISPRPIPVSGSSNKVEIPN